MVVVRRNRLFALGVGLLALACGGDGGNGVEPPGPPDHLVKSGGDGQSWYFNNPLPTAYSVTVQDLHNRAVPNVSVDWSITTGGGTLSANPSTTNANGIATTVHTLASATTYIVNATVTGVGSITFGATAAAPPTTASVSLSGLRFDPSAAVVQVNTGTAGVGDVNWTWNDGVIQHNVTFTGPAPTGGDIAARSSGTITRTFSAVGTYNYTCTLHAGMNGTITVVH
jgi:plastocyanin